MEGGRWKTVEAVEEKVRNQLVRKQLGRTTARVVGEGGSMR